MMLKRFRHRLFCKMIFSCFKVNSFKTNIKNTLNCFLIGLLTQTHSISTVTVTHLYSVFSYTRRLVKAMERRRPRGQCLVTLKASAAAASDRPHAQASAKMAPVT